jgi:biopolymer transport protein ExbD
MMEDELPETVSIDVTPMATIALILVIIFISSASTWTQQILKVELPKAATAESERKQNLSVTLTAQGEIAIDDVAMSWDTLMDGIMLGLENNKDKFVIIRADKQARYGDLVRIMGVAKQAGAKSISIATEQPGLAKKEKEKA